MSEGNYYSVCVILCVGRGLANWLIPPPPGVQGVLPTMYSIKTLKRRPRTINKYNYYVLALSNGSRLHIYIKGS
jgi:hypothetical protein